LAWIPWCPLRIELAARYRLFESYSSNDTLRFYTLSSICRRNRHDDSIQIRSSAGHRKDHSQLPISSPRIQHNHLGPSPPLMVRGCDKVRAAHSSSRPAGSFILPGTRLVLLGLSHSRSARGRAAPAVTVSAREGRGWCGYHASLPRVPLSEWHPLGGPGVVFIVGEAWQGCAAGWGYGAGPCTSRSAE
jgi:hypothetical protein